MGYGGSAEVGPLALESGIAPGLWSPASWLFFRPSGACGILAFGTHGLRRGLHSVAAPRLEDAEIVSVRDGFGV